MQGIPMIQLGITCKILFLYFLYSFMTNSKAELQGHPDTEQLHGGYYLLAFCLATLL